MERWIKTCAVCTRSCANIRFFTNNQYEVILLTTNTWYEGSRETLYWAPLLVSLFILGKCLLVSLRYEVLQYGKVNDKVIDIFSKGWIN